MNILIIEDDETKASALENYLRARLPGAQIDHGQSLHSGLRLALEDKADLIFLDMTMTNFDRGKDEDGGRPHAFAGREILRRMKRQRIDTPVVVFTQFRRFDDDKNSMTLDELTNDLKEKFPNFLGTVQYQLNVEGWKDQIDKYIQVGPGGSPV